MTRSQTAGVEDLPDDVVAAAGNGASDAVDNTLRDGFFAERARHIAQFERQYLTDLLRRHTGDVSAAARDASVPRGTLYRLMKSHSLDGASFRR